jgi:hypothetical protein
MTKMNYYLRKNPLAGESDFPYMARVARKETLRQDDVIDRMLKKNTTVTRQDILVVLDLMKETVREEALSGNPIITDLFKIQPGIRGGFTTSDDEFDGSRHRVILNLNASPDFKKEFLKSAELAKVGAREDKLVIEQIFDYATWAPGETFPAGGTIELRGRNLRSDVKPEISLVREGSDEPITLTRIFNWADRNIVCALPGDLEAGRYQISAVLKKGLKTISVDYENPIIIT